MQEIMKRFSKRQDFGAIVSAGIIFVVFSVIDPSGWLSRSTFANVFHFSAILGFLAMGEALVLITKEIDLSLGSIYGLVGVAFITLAESMGIVGAFFAAMVLALLLGGINAFIILRGNLPSMIVTLSTLFAYRGIIYIWTGGSIKSFSEAARAHWLTRLFGGEFLGIENAVIWAVLALIILNTLLQRTRTGNHLLAVGGDAESALSHGVSLVRTKTKAYLLASGLAGLSGIITLCDKPQTHVTLGTLMELEAIASAVIGGCILTGGRGSVIGALIGAFIITSVRYELIALGAPSAWFITFVGIVLIIAVLFNQALSRWLRSSA
jgi:simple sugar transport system permease protein/ribose transport system permease protein